MLYLTGQLLLFLLVAAFAGFLVGWFTRGAVAEALRGARLPSSVVSRVYPPAASSETADDADDLLWFKSDSAGRR